MRDQLKKSNRQRLVVASKSANKSPVERKSPPASLLLQEVLESSYRAVGRKYGVSDTTIRNWLKKADLVK